MKIKSSKEIAKTKWLTFKETTYLDKKNQEQKWEFISRNENRQIVTIICKSKRYNKYLFISQPRVPIDKVEISFPAGLIDKGETPEEAALRELKEETGYTGTIKRKSILLPKSSGLSDESTYIVECVVDENVSGKADMEDTEDIQSFWKTPRQFIEMAENINSSKMVISSMVWSFLLGYFHGYKK